MESYLKLVLVCFVLFHTMLVQGDASIQREMDALKSEFALHVKTVNSELEAKLSAMHSELLTTNSKLQTSQTELQTIKSELQTTKAEHILTQSSLRSTQSELRSTQSDLRMTQTLLQKTISDFTNTNGDTKQATDKLPRRLAETDTFESLPRTHVLRVYDGQETAFSSKLRTSPHHMSVGQTVIFDTNILNVGSGYNNLSGVFTCPIEGVYYFAVTIMAFQGEQIETELVVNGGQVMVTYSGGYQQLFNQGGNSVLVRLNVGDRVWVRILDTIFANKDNIRIVEIWSTFSGFKIQ